MKGLREFIQRATTRAGNRLRVTRIGRWLGESDDVVWVSAIKRPEEAVAAEFPSLQKYRGLRAILETHNDTTTKWHFVWNNLEFGRQYESNLQSEFGKQGEAIERYAICSASTLKRPWKTATTWMVAAAAIITSLAAIFTHTDEIANSVTKWRHQPVMTLPPTETIRVSSTRHEPRKVTLYGDPFFRARLINLSMQIDPDPSGPATKPLTNPKIDLSTERSVDVGGELALALPFDNIPPGRYLVRLQGKVETEHRTADFTPPPLHLDSRAAYSAFKGKIQPWPPEASAAAKFEEALVEIQLIFGQPPQPTLNLRVSVDGSWTGWELVDPLPGGTLDRLSKNTPTNAKAVVFGLRNFPVEPFSARVLRIRLKAPAPVTREEWEKNVGELYVGLLE